ncbi:MAG: class I SAM-dependent methyltransferase [Hahellaceae bacterium]|nr:class I SAM-dependent methyltransferase [Hahellaceae bacterium]MCP5170578.1 class I SAM-dependent methyltransferase [Hahellaceae bacterium]
MLRIDRSPVSLTGLFTGQVWHENGLAPDGYESRLGKWLYRSARPLDQLSDRWLGMSLETLLLQRHLLIDQLTRDAITQGYTQIVEIASGLSSRANRLLLRYPDKELTWIEADLPDMVQWKTRSQEKTPMLDTRWHIQPVNILREQGELSVEQLLAPLKPNQKTLIITEGLVNYFPLPIISEFWKRLSHSLRMFPEARYLLDIWPALENHPNYWLTKISSQAIGLATRRKVPLHFSDDDSIRLGMLRSGFALAQIYHPDQEGRSLGLPRMRHASLFRLVQAETRAPGLPD